MLSKRQFNVTGWGLKKWGFLFRPDDNTKKYPIVIFFHGRGEIGSSEAQAETLKAFGPLAFVGAGTDFMILAIQKEFWSPVPDWYQFILENDKEVKEYWDGKNIMWTGLSAGGQQVLDCISLGYSGVFVPMSAALTGKKIDYTQPEKVWAFHADNDTMCPLGDVKAIYDKLQAKVTVYHDGHGNWNKFYDPKYQEDGMNIYQFAFGKVAQPPGPAPPQKEIFCEIDLNDGKMFTLYMDKSYKLE